MRKALALLDGRSSILDSVAPKLRAFYRPGTRSPCKAGSFLHLFPAGIATLGIIWSFGTTFFALVGSTNLTSATANHSETRKGGLISFESGLGRGTATANISGSLPSPLPPLIASASGVDEELGSASLGQAPSVRTPLGRVANRLPTAPSDTRPSRPIPRSSPGSRGERPRSSHQSDTRRAAHSNRAHETLTPPSPGSRDPPSLNGADR